MAETCVICGKDRTERHNHALNPIESDRNAPQCFLINVAEENKFSAAQTLALARRELRNYFPGKAFEILPYAWAPERTGTTTWFDNIRTTMYIVVEI